MAHVPRFIAATIDKFTLKKYEVMALIEREVGEIFRFGYDMVLVCEAPQYESGCGRCILNAAGDCIKSEAYELFGPCSSSLRTDKKQVFFKYIP